MDIGNSSTQNSRRRPRDAKALLLGLVLALPSLPAHAGPRDCLADAAHRFGHGRAILDALMRQESGGHCARRHRPNANGSYDIGCMGINSSWLPMLEKKFGISEYDLYTPCTNIHVGAWLYARNVRRFGDSWRAVGAYNAKNEQKRIAYAWKIQSKLSAQR
jgi:soluble lytic murein transglycosylase-like protein